MSDADIAVLLNEKIGGGKMPVAERKDPYMSFRFLVEIQGLIVGGFSEISIKL